MKKGNYKRNTLKRKLEEGAIGTIANGPNNSNMCDLIGQFGFDAAFVDFEHGGVSWSELSDISRACELWDMASVVRVNTLEPSLILRTLDLGASSIMVPHIITVEDAEIAAKSCRYPPLGIRGVAGSRRAYGVDNYFDVANQEVQCIALIEDHEAVMNLPKLVKVSGIDVFYVAPSDMAASMGKTGNASDHLVQKTIKNAIQIIVDSGNIAGTLVNEGNMEYFIDLGARCLGIPWPLLLEDASKRFFETLSSRFGS